MLKAYADLNRSLSAQFVFCLLGTMLCVLFGAFSDVLVIYMLDAPTATLWAHQGITVKALAGDAILFAAPILATIPYVGAGPVEGSICGKHPSGTGAAAVRRI